MNNNNNCKTILGLDVGIASIGWALIKLNDEELQYENASNTKNVEGILFGDGEIIDSGVRVFDAAEIAKTKAPSAEPRRIARLNRRRLFRKSFRKQKIKDLCIKHKIVNYDCVYGEENIFTNIKNNKDYKDVWVLRKEALERLLNGGRTNKGIIAYSKT